MSAGSITTELSVAGDLHLVFDHASRSSTDKRTPARLREALDELQYQISCWDGSWIPNGATHYDALQVIADEARGQHDEIYYHALLLEGFVSLKVNLLGFTKAYCRSGRLGSLYAVTQTRTPWAAAASYCLGRIYTSLAGSVELRQQYVTLKRSYLLFASITNDVALPVSILLPGIRSETAPDLLEEVVPFASDPLTRTVPIPYRYRAIRAVSVANLARSLGRYDEGSTFLEIAVGNCNSSRQRGSNVGLMSLNIEICQFMATLIGAKRGTKKANLAQHQIERILDRLGSGNDPLDQLKKREYLAACHAGLACICSRRGDRAIHRDLLHNITREILRIRPVQASTFWVDPVYLLAHADDEEARQEFEQIIHDRADAADRIVDKNSISVV